MRRTGNLSRGQQDTRKILKRKKRTDTQYDNMKYYLSALKNRPRYIKLLVLYLLTCQFVCYALFDRTVCSSVYTASNDRILVSIDVASVLREAGET